MGNIGATVDRVLTNLYNKYDNEEEVWLKVWDIVSECESNDNWE